MRKQALFVPLGDHGHDRCSEFESIEKHTRDISNKEVVGFLPSKVVKIILSPDVLISSYVIVIS